MTGLHCEGCDSYDCKGFARPVAAHEPAPPLRPTNVATPEQQKAHVAHARQTLAAVRDGKRGTT